MIWLLHKLKWHRVKWLTKLTITPFIWILFTWWDQYTLSKDPCVRPQAALQTLDVYNYWQGQVLFRYTCTLLELSYFAQHMIWWSTVPLIHSVFYKWTQIGSTLTTLFSDKTEYYISIYSKIMGKSPFCILTTYFGYIKYI